MIMETSVIAFITANLTGMLGTISPMAVWSAIVLALTILIAFCIGAEVRRRIRRDRCRGLIRQQRTLSATPQPTRRSSALKMGSERESMFVPGDPYPWNE